ncbi:MAG: hypothetical protein HOV80_34595 [Polyangiaceae bacterium]|nr:hypothetical protein [Polyangiaceae bacterium]
MSAWPKLGDYAERPDLESKVAAIDSEAKAAGLELVREVETKGESGTVYVVRSYRGMDRLGRPNWACRVASPFGVIMALGPDAADASEPHEVVFEIDAGGSRLFASPGQLVAGGDPEVLLKNARGELAAWHLLARGASEIPVDLASPPTELVELSNRELALAAVVSAPPESDHPLALLRVAAFDGARFSDRAPAARTFHEEEREAANVVPETETAEARFDRRTRRAFHAILAGEKKKDVAAAFSRDDVPPELQSALKARAQWLEKL